MKPIFKLCYDYLMQLALLDSLRERRESWGISALGEELRCACLQSVLLALAGGSSCSSCIGAAAQCQRRPLQGRLLSFPGHLQAAWA